MRLMRGVERAAQETDARHRYGASTQVRGRLMCGEGDAMSDIQAIGDAIAGGVVARSVEPRAGEGSDGHTDEHNCLNCGAGLIGPFCNQCGQHAHAHRTLAAFFHDFAHGVLHFEGKIWRTLPLLAWKPGELTRRYIDGQRASFVSPVALFLFAVFLMFAVLSATGNLSPHFNAKRDLASAERSTVADIHRLEKKRVDPKTDADDISDIDRSIKSKTEDLAVIRDLRKRGVTEANFSRNAVDLHSDVTWFDDAYHKAKENPDLLIYKLKSNSYKWSWALIPLSVPFVWLLFPFSRRFRLYDHVVFVTYSLSFMTFLVAAGALISAAGLNSIASLLFFIPPIHMYRQLRGTYGLSRWGGVWRTILLTSFATVVLIGFVILMVVLGVLD
jgi:hypothetical protein